MARGARPACARTSGEFELKIGGRAQVDCALFDSDSDAEAVVGELTTLTVGLKRYLDRTPTCG